MNFQTSSPLDYDVTSHRYFTPQVNVAKLQWQMMVRHGPVRFNFIDICSKYHSLND